MFGSPKSAKRNSYFGSVQERSTLKRGWNLRAGSPAPLNCIEWSFSKEMRQTEFDRLACPQRAQQPESTTPSATNLLAQWDTIESCIVAITAASYRLPIDIFPDPARVHIQVKLVASSIVSRPASWWGRTVAHSPLVLEALPPW